MAIRRAFAQEDTNLQTATVSTSRLVDYRDIDLVFKAKADSGEIFKKTEANAVKQAIKTLVMTNFMEKPFQPDFGCDILSQLFENYDEDIDEFIRETIRVNVKRYEPRARVLNVVVEAQPDNNLIEVTVTFKVVNTNEVVVFTTTLSRLR